ncbi:MAG: sugar ABC transporter ATP-binding protein [Lentisphaerae bacterium]|nr:sugar ABC transporter ATP-binding protein [Lentisphaerota bacterium]
MTRTTTDESLLVAAHGIRKSFPGVLALDGVDFAVRAGRVHAVVGENGAGKSTLMKVLGGVYQPDAGTVRVSGKPAQFRSPHEAILAGISVIYQELDLAPHLTAAENIHLGREPRRYGVWTDRASMARATAALFEDMGMRIPVDVPVEQLALADRQMVEIAKAISRQSQVIVMDEPTSSLTEHEVAVLYRIIRRLREQGRAIVYISHRLKEIFDLADEITVMRDGRVVGGGPLCDFDRKAIVRLMVGRDVQENTRRTDQAGTEVVLRVQGLGLPGVFADVSFDLHAGETLGVCGLAGCGREELARAVFGLCSYGCGSVDLLGQPLPADGPQAAIRRKLGFLSEDRRSEGIFAQMSVRANATIMILRRLAWRLVGWLPAAAEQAELTRHTASMQIRYAGPNQDVRLLSGGNQQKVLLARVLATGCRVLILCEPTRGVDIGAKAEIYALLRELNRQGVAVLLISSDLPEVLEVCHRTLVMYQGRLTGNLSRDAMSEEGIMQCATGLMGGAA